MPNPLSLSSKYLFTIYMEKLIIEVLVNNSIENEQTRHKIANEIMGKLGDNIETLIKMVFR
jgi:hypothetical protein